MVLQSSGAISLYNIQTEFGGSTPISMSEYYGAASGIPSSGAISFSNFYGKSAQSSGAPTPVASSIPARSGGVGNNTNFEIVRGLEANNLTRSEGTTHFDYKETTDLGGSSDVEYSNVIIQAKPGDELQLVARLKTQGYYKEYAEFWVWLGVSWYRFASPNDTFYSDKDFTEYYTIPSSTPAGNYALAVACSYYTLGSTNYRSWKSYSLHVWT